MSTFLVRWSCEDTNQLQVFFDNHLQHTDFLFSVEARDIPCTPIILITVFDLILIIRALKYSNNWIMIFQFSRWFSSFKNPSNVKLHTKNLFIGEREILQYVNWSHYWILKHKQRILYQGIQYKIKLILKQGFARMGDVSIFNFIVVRVLWFPISKK